MKKQRREKESPNVISVSKIAQMSYIDLPLPFVHHLCGYMPPTHTKFEILKRLQIYHNNLSAHQ